MNSQDSIFNASGLATKGVHVVWSRGQASPRQARYCFLAVIKPPSFLCNLLNLTSSIDSQRLLENEFPQVPVRFIKETLHKYRYLFKAYAILEAAERDYDQQKTGPYRRCRFRAPKAIFTEGSAMTDGKLMEELGAARRKRELQEGKSNRQP